MFVTFIWNDVPACSMYVNKGSGEEGSVSIFSNQSSLKIDRWHIALQNKHNQYE